MRDGPPQMPKRNAVGIGVTGGFFSGLLGIGGGTVMVPLLVLVGRLTQQSAHALSLAAMLPIAAVAVLIYAVAGEVNALAAAALAVGSIGGARVGAHALSNAPEGLLKLAFGVFLLIAAAMLVI